MKKLALKVGATATAVIAAYFSGMAYEQGRKKGKEMPTVSPSEFMGSAASTIGEHLTAAYSRFASRGKS